MKINEVCQRTNITKRNIHFYIKEGLVSPSVDEKNGYYNFSEEDCIRLHLINNLRNAELPLAVIRSVFKHPYTAGYYISSHMHELRNKQRHTEQTLISLKYLLDNMPIEPDLSTISRIAGEAAIPQFQTVTSPETSFDPYSIAVVNRFIWGAFIQEPLTEFQEFLWAKVNRLTTESPTPEYIRLCRTIYSMNPESVNGLLSYDSAHYRIIGELSSEELPVYARKQIPELRKILNHPGYRITWMENYGEFFLPMVLIQASYLSELVQELSPSYLKYVQNIGAIVQYLYDELESDSGKDLQDSLIQALGNRIDIHHAHHGELGALLELPRLNRILKKR